MGQHLSSGGCGFGDEHHEFEPFQGTGGTVHALVVALGYAYSPGNELTSFNDGEMMVHTCVKADVEDIVYMRDEYKTDSKLFPFHDNVLDQMRLMGQRCKPGDFFVMFFAGHGENVPDRPPYDEDDGFDEAFVLPGPAPELHLDEKYFLIDDEFADALENYFHKDVRLLILSDCCHSATICDLDSRRWKYHRIISISACQDHEESADTGKGGILSICIDKVIEEMGLARGSNEYSIQTVFDKVQAKALSICDQQEMSIHYDHCDPSLEPWPLPRPWWKRLHNIGRSADDLIVHEH